MPGRTGTNSVNERKLRSQARKLLRNLGYRRTPPPAELCRGLSGQLGVPIDLAGRSLPTVRSFGCVIPFPDKYLITYLTDLSVERQNYTIYHEIAHIFLGHLDASGTDTPMLCGSLLVDRDAPPSGSHYDQHAEWEAETLGAILSDWSKLPIRASWADLGRTGEALGSAFGGRGV